MVKKQILRAREHSRESLLKKLKSESGQKKLTFNVSCYPVFQIVRNILQKNFKLYGPFFYGWGSTASRLQPHRGGSLLFTIQFPEFPGTRIIYSSNTRLRTLSFPGYSYCRLS